MTRIAERLKAYYELRATEVPEDPEAHVRFEKALALAASQPSR